MATDRRDGRGRFVAERGLYCLPTGRRFELTANAEDLDITAEGQMNDSTETESRFQDLLLCNCSPDNKEGHSQNEERGIKLATRQQRQDRSRQKQNRSYQKAPLSNKPLHSNPASAQNVSV
jgi:hypothetical protein